MSILSANTWWESKVDYWPENRIVSFKQYTENYVEIFMKEEEGKK